MQQVLGVFWPIERWVQSISFHVSSRLVSLWPSQSQCPKSVFIRVSCDLPAWRLLALPAAPHSSTTCSNNTAWRRANASEINQSHSHPRRQPMAFVYSTFWNSTSINGKDVMTPHNMIGWYDGSYSDITLVCCSHFRSYWFCSFCLGDSRK